MSLRLSRMLPVALMCAAACARLSAPEAAVPAGGGPPGAPGGTDGTIEGPGYGLVGVVPERERALVLWRAVPPPSSPPAVALFVSRDPATLFAGPPRVVTPSAGALVVEGLDPEEDHWFGLALDGGAGWRPVGPVLTARTIAPVHVDAGAPPGGDGRTPATAFDSLAAGVFTAFADGGGNVWVRGAFDGVSLGVPPGVDLYGGFAPGFLLEERDVALHPTVLSGRASLPVLAFESSGTRAVVDGLSLRGGAGAVDGVDVDRHPIELRQVEIRGCGRGVRLRNALGAGAVACAIVASECAGQSGAGISIAGAFTLLVEASRCVANGGEGLDADDLLAPEGETARLVLRDCVFSHNGSEGVDVDLGALVGAGAVGGRLEVLIDGCVADDNALDGVLLDVEHESAPAWASDVVVRGTTARENGRAGVHLDMDARGSGLVLRCRLEANAGHGLHVTSESATGVVVVAASACAGNHGHGVRAELGNYGVLLSHCVLAGNRLAGLSSDGVAALATSSAAWLQAAPWPAAQDSLALPAGTTGAFAAAPVRYLQVLDAAGGVLGLAGPSDFGAGTPCELAADGVARAAAPAGPARATVTPARVPRTPTSLALFAPGTPTSGAAVRDWRPGAASPLLGAGMAAPGSQPVDIGPYGAPLGGAPGVEEALVAAPFALRATSPAIATGVGASETLTLEFADDVDGASLPLGVAAVDGTGAPLPIVPASVGRTVVVPPPAGGWPAGSRLLLHGDLRSLDGRRNLAPVAVPVR